MKPKVLFVFDHEYEDIWKDGLWAALELLKKDFEIDKYNLHGKNPTYSNITHHYDFVLGWGGFNSSVAENLADWTVIPKGLCLGGYAPYIGQTYDVLFYETEWSKRWLLSQDYKGELTHAFGVNTDIYKTTDIYFENPNNDNFYENVKLWDYLTVGAFSTWKRQALLLDKEGTRMAVGQIQKGNLGESIDIIGELLLGGCMVSDMVAPEVLANMYNLSKTVYIPADIMGGGERAILEARACGAKVEVEPDNPKLQELMVSPIWDQFYYYKQLKEGILSCL